MPPTDLPATQEDLVSAIRIGVVRGLTQFLAYMLVGYFIARLIRRLVP